MNWKGGLLRLWMVCSLLWVAVATPPLVSFFSEEQVLSAEEQGLQTAADEAECAADPSSAACFPTVHTRTVWRWPPWWALALEAAVPLLLLGIGATVYWVVAGFRRSN